MGYLAALDAFEILPSLFRDVIDLMTTLLKGKAKAIPDDTDTSE